MVSFGTDPVTLLVLVVMALAAAITNGAVGYGFSTLFTPVAVLFVSPQLLNPALVVVELCVNLTLLYREREVIPLTWRRALPVILGLAPGAVLGSVALDLLLDANMVRIVLFSMLLPFTLMQILGIRRPIRHERRWRPVLGCGIGFIYALTTISGPPLAAFWNNQNLGKNEFRCTVAQIRVAESSFTASTYLALTFLVGWGSPKALFTASSLAFVPFIGLPVLVGVPLGVLVFRSISKARFLRVVATIDSGLITFGLLTAFERTKIIDPTVQYAVLALGLGSLALLAARVLRNLPANAKVAGPTAPGSGSREVASGRKPGFVLWIEGLPSSGKSTLAREVAASLQAQGWRAEVLDGRETRRILPPSPGRTRADRENRAGRVSRLASLLADNGAAAIVPMTSPIESARAAARAAGGERFFEVWLRCPLEVCMDRDSKGLYRKARKGGLATMVGLNDPFEEPRSPDLVVDTSRKGTDESAEDILRFLGERSAI